MRRVIAEFSKLPRTLRRLVLRNTEARRLCADWLNSPDLAHIDLRDNLIESLDVSTFPHQGLSIIS